MLIDIEWHGVTTLRIGQIGLWVSVALSLLSAFEYTSGYYRTAKSKL